MVELHGIKGQFCQAKSKLPDNGEVDPISSSAAVILLVFVRHEVIAVCLHRSVGRPRQFCIVLWFQVMTYNSGLFLAVLVGGERTSLYSVSALVAKSGLGVRVLRMLNPYIIPLCFSE